MYSDDLDFPLYAMCFIIKMLYINALSLSKDFVLYWKDTCCICYFSFSKVLGWTSVSLKLSLPYLFENGLTFNKKRLLKHSYSDGYDYFD